MPCSSVSSSRRSERGSRAASLSASGVPVRVHPSMLKRGTGIAAGSISLTTARRRNSGIGASRRCAGASILDRSMRRGAVAGPGTCTFRYMTAYDDALRLAHVLADTADSLTMARFRAQDLVVETKPDLTPVSDADKRVEEAIRSTLARARPRDAVHGEEMADTGHGPRRWVLDPIDGTKNFVRGVPVWATLIALFDGDEPVVGLVSAPALNRRWWAAKDVGAWTGRRLDSATRCPVSEVTPLGDASLSYSSLSGWEERGVLDGFLDLTRSVWRTRAYGDFWSYCLLAEGAVDIACEPEVSVWDLAALDVIVREAGGRFTDLTGMPGPSGGDAPAPPRAPRHAAPAPPPPPEARRDNRCGRARRSTSASNCGTAGGRAPPPVSSTGPSSGASSR